MIDNKYINEIKGINIYISEESKVSDKAKILFNSLILGKSEIKEEIPRLQYERSLLYINDYAISRKDAYTIVREKEISDYYENNKNFFCLYFNKWKVSIVYSKKLTYN